MTVPRSSADGAGDGSRSFGAATDRKQRNKARRDASLPRRRGSAQPGRLDEDPINNLPVGGVMMWGKDSGDGMIHSKSTNFDKRG
ncbi:MAG TPA: hypothetical protein VIJ18_17075 [Microbacteriaceae bacterium]